MEIEFLKTFAGTIQGDVEVGHNLLKNYFISQ